MSLRSGALALLVSTLAAPLAQAAVGYQHFTVADPQGSPIEVGVWYPTDAVPSLTRIESFQAQVAADAPLKGRNLPLVVMSHGTGGSFAGHYDTAMALAEAGFVAAALTHPGDNWRDHSRTVEVTRDRPRQLKVLVDGMTSSWRDHGHIDGDRIGAFGFSAGGFTVLVAAGGEADLMQTLGHCRAHPQFFDCKLVAKSPPPPPPRAWTHDARIKAVVAAAPALGFTFDRAGLTGVRQPVQLWRAADDRVLPAPYYADAVREALPQPAEFHDVARAGHYDFLAPCSSGLIAAAPEICGSAPGFDRAAFHADFNRQVVDFFSRSLRPAR